MECGKCHKFPSENWNKVRTGNEAFPDVTEYPQHESCLNCHRQQFFRGAKPMICSICHISPSPRDSRRHPFPNPREIFDISRKGVSAVSDFVVKFPHDKHIEIVSQAEPRNGIMIKAAFARAPAKAGEESCSVCHRTYQPQGESSEEFVTKPPEKFGDEFWLKKGTFKTAPIGHTTCFTCHSTDTGILPAPNDCAACHTLKATEPKGDFDAKLASSMQITDKIMLTSWRRRRSSGTFRHEWFSHAEQNCSACHNVLTINTADPATTKVSIGACAVCHVTATSDDGGAVNFEADARRKDPKFQCVKCHIAYGRLAIPVGHLEAIKTAAAK
jgi:hypothetical protein